MEDTEKNKVLRFAMIQAIKILADAHKLVEEEIDIESDVIIEGKEYRLKFGPIDDF